MSPELSIVVIVYRMARQAANTLYTLGAAYQRDVSASDYEVVVVENASDENLDEASVGSLEGQFRYVRRDEAGVSPAAAINFGLSLARGRSIGLMIDGARMVTPRVVRYALDAFALSREALVVVPGYHLGPDEHHRHLRARYDEAVERELLDSVEWGTDGYALFDIACPSGANPRGLFHPLLESNCMFASRAAFEAVGGADERFRLPGGGALNLFMYRSLGVRPGSRLVVVPGEGSFHQFHGGVTTAHWKDRLTFLARQKRQLEGIWGGHFDALRREAVLLGEVTERAMPLLEWSAAWGVRRHRRLRRDRETEWPDEPPPAGRGSTEARPRAAPGLSLVVLCGEGASWEDGLFSLSPAYQREVSSSDYEVVVVDTSPAGGPPRALSSEPAGNVRLVRPKGPGLSADQALAAGLAESRGEFVGLMMEGPRILSPRVIRYALDAFAVHRDALVTVPEYDLDPARFLDPLGTGAPETRFADSSRSATWRSDGYSLFEAAGPRGDARRRGGRLFDPAVGPGLALLPIGRLDTPHRPSRGGEAADGTWSRVVRAAEDLRWVLLPGEGAFRPSSGSGAHSATTVPVAGRRPFLVGAVTGPALPVLEAGARAAAGAWDGAAVARELIPPSGNPDREARMPSDSSSDPTVYVPPSMRWFEPWRAPDGGWSESLPLAYDLVEAVRPDLLVAVGVRRAVEYLSYCQSVHEHALPTVCYGVGTWEDGDDPGGGKALLRDTRDHIRYRHPGFAYLLRMTSTDAAGQFADGTVGLVHLDDTLTSDDLGRELERWYAKLIPGGVLVCSHIDEPGSTSYRTWSRFAREANASSFDGHPGPSAMRKSGGPALEGGPRLLQMLFGDGTDEPEALRRAYARIARYLELRSAIGLSEYGRARGERGEVVSAPGDAAG